MCVFSSLPLTGSLAIEFYRLKKDPSQFPTKQGPRCLAQALCVIRKAAILPVWWPIGHCLGPESSPSPDDTLSITLPPPVMLHNLPYSCTSFSPLRCPWALVKTLSIHQGEKKKSMIFFFFNWASRKVCEYGNQIFWVPNWDFCSGIRLKKIVLQM